MKAAGPRIERSTCVSAAKLTIARGRCRSSSVRTRFASPISPRTKTWRGSAPSGIRLRRLPAYVRLSRLTTGSPSSSSQSRMKLAPMKPAPPVTRIMGRRAPRLTFVGAASLASALPVVAAIPADEPRQTLRERRARREAGGAAQPLDRRIRRAHVARLQRPFIPDRRASQQALEQRDEGVEVDRLVIADVVDRIRLLVRIGLRRLREDARHTFDDVVHVSEVALHPPAIEDVDRASFENRFREQHRRLVRAAPWTIDGKEAQPRRRQPVKVAVAMGH